MLEPNQPPTAASDRVKKENIGTIAAKATKSGPNAIHNRLAHENETDISSEWLLVQRFPNNILDIGCFKGKWTDTARRYFPTASFTLIDAIHYQSAQVLAQSCFYEYYVELLSDNIRQVEWYEEKNSGDSIFRERTLHFAATQATLRQSTTLDVLLANKKFDLIKIDTQGSELPILRGGRSLVDTAEVIVMEIPFCGQYNLGVSDFLSHIKFMDSINFSVYDLSEVHYFKGSLIQVDIFFVKKNSSIFQKVQASIDTGRWWEQEEGS